MRQESDAVGGLADRDVVVDTAGQFVYIGRLVAMDDQFVELADVDVHDGTESSTSKELYIMDARKYGIRKNRLRVLVRAQQVVSMSLLQDVIEY